MAKTRAFFYDSWTGFWGVRSVPKSLSVAMALPCSLAPCSSIHIGLFFFLAPAHLCQCTQFLGFGSQAKDGFRFNTRLQTALAIVIAFTWILTCLWVKLMALLKVGARQDAFRLPAFGQSRFSLAPTQTRLMFLFCRICWIHTCSTWDLTLIAAPSQATPSFLLKPMDCWALTWAWAAKPTKPS